MPNTLDSQDVSSGRHTSLKAVRSSNKALLLNTLRRERELSRYDLSKQTGLDPATANKMIKELLEAGFVKETGKGTSSGGRRPIMLQIEESKLHFMTIMMRRNCLVFRISDFGFREILRQQIDIPEPLEPAAILRTIREHLSLASEYQLLGVGVGVEGPVNSLTGVVLNCGCFKGGNLAVGEMIQEALSVPVLVEARSRVMAYAEYSDYPDRGNLLAIYAGTGVGAALVTRRGVFRGESGFAGEIGHTQVTNGTRRCILGHKGCLESELSVTVLIDDISKMEARAVPLSDLDTLYKSSAQVREYLDAKAELLAGVIASSVDLFDPNQLVLGGELFLECESLYEHVVETVSARSYSAQSGGQFMIRRSTILKREIEKHLVRILWNHIGEMATA